MIEQVSSTRLAARSARTVLRDRLRNWFGTWPVQGFFLLVIAFILRAATFGDPHLHIDEAFYFLVGQEMHNGAVPYIDIWDRKPLGLFLIYWAITGISSSVIAYQVTATLFAAGTALIIVQIARLWAGVLGSILAGLAYLVWLGPLLGFGGQAPVFYNLPIALAFLLVLRSSDDLAEGRVPSPVFGAMLLGGIALTVKQTVIFECALLGLLVLYRLRAAGASPGLLVRTCLLAMTLGLAPMAVIGLWYWWHGYWTEFWMAMTTSSLARPPLVAFAMVHNLKILAQLLFFPILLAAGGIALAIVHKRTSLVGALVGWMVAATLGLAVIRLMADHHALPMLMPLTIAAAPLLDRKVAGPVLLAILLVQSVAIWSPFNRALHRLSTIEMERMTAFIKANRMGRGLFVFDGPPLLYSMSGTPPLSPLVFPTHFTMAFERDISQFSTEAEILSVLAKRPGVIVMTDKEKDAPPHALAALHDYTQNHCKVRIEALAIEPRGQPTRQVLYGRCS